METTADFSMQPAEVADASNQLDALAARVDKLMTTKGLPPRWSPRGETKCPSGSP
jgi:hypothetical protein